jgi:hypothetical protein
MGELSAEELVQCQQLADTWNKQPNLKDIQQKCITGRILLSGTWLINHYRATKRLPALVKRFMEMAD